MGPDRVQSLFFVVEALAPGEPRPSPGLKEVCHSVGTAGPFSVGRALVDAASEHVSALSPANGRRLLWAPGGLGLGLLLVSPQWPCPVLVFRTPHLSGFLAASSTRDA